MANKLWDGRFAERTDQSVEAFTASIDIDKRLYRYDIEGSVAHCQTLAKAGVISDEEASVLIEGLGQIAREIEHGEFEFDVSLEDIHMHIESRLLQKVGKVAQKLHTARSRNDQVALDVRLYLREEIKHIIAQTTALRQVVVALAKNNLDSLLPGYTHLQRAQPISFAHHLMAYYEMFSRDEDRLRDCSRRVDVMPLGTAALAGTTYAIDRQYTAELLNFPKITANSLDTVADRDFVIEFLSVASIYMVHLSRLSEELVLWSTSEFAFIELPDAFATGSSIMPQKKNPDVPELVRGKTGRVFGNLIALMTLMKSLPLAYNRDMQEDKAPLFDTVDTLKACLGIYCKMLPNLKVKSDAMRKAATVGFLNATDMADYLVTKGVPFREAHSVVGNAVGYALQHQKELDVLTLKELKSFSSLIEEDIFEVLRVDNMVDRRVSFGGTARQNVADAIRAAESELGHKPS